MRSSGRPETSSFVALGLVAALSGCAEGEFQRLNPLADFSLPKFDLALPEMPQLTYAASDLLPGLARQSQVPPNVEGGIGGFTGKVDPLDTPLHWQAGALAEFRLNVYVRADQRDYLLQGRGKTVGIGPDLLWDLQVVSFEDRHRRMVALRPPLVQARMTATPEGAVRGLAIDFPAHRERRASAPERGSGEYRALADGLRYLVQPLPTRAVTVGDSLGRPPALELVLSGTSLAPESDTTALRIAGRARYRGREVIVVRQEGAISYRQNDDRQRIAIAGHVLYDLLSGLPLASVLRLGREGMLDGQPIDDGAHIQTEIVLADSSP